jgi:hypothetical protein
MKRASVAVRTTVRTEAHAELSLGVPLNVQCPQRRRQKRRPLVHPIAAVASVEPLAADAAHPVESVWMLSEVVAKM